MNTLRIIAGLLNIAVGVTILIRWKAHRMMILAAALILVGLFVVTVAGGAQAPPAKPPPGAVLPPSLNQPWRPVDGGPQAPRRPEPIWVENPFLLPAVPKETEKEEKCQEVAGIKTCQKW